MSDELDSMQHFECKMLRGEAVDMFLFSALRVGHSVRTLSRSDDGEFRAIDVLIRESAGG